MVPTDIEKRGRKILDTWKSIFDIAEIPLDARELLVPKLYRLTLVTSCEITERLVIDRKSCIPVVLTPDQKNAFNHIVKLIIVKSIDYATSPTPVQYCNNPIFCCNPFHHNLLSAAQFAKFMQEKLPEHLKSDTLSKAEKIAGKFLCATNFEAVNAIRMFCHETDECIFRSGFRVDLLKVQRRFKKVLFYLNYPEKQFEDNFTLCSYSTQEKICFNIRHNTPNKYMGIFIQPLPVLPNNPHQSEKTKIEVPIKNESKNPVNSTAAKTESSAHVEVKNEAGSAKETFDEPEEDLDETLKNEEYDEYNENLKILENLEKEDSKVTENILSEEDEAVTNLWNRINNSFMLKLPKEMKENKSGLKEVIFHMIYGGKRVEFLKETANWDIIAGKAEKYIQENAVSPRSGYEDKHGQAKTKILPFIGYCFETTEMANYVLKYQEEMKIKNSKIEDIEAKLYNLSLELSKIFVSQITDAGFKEQWANDMRPNTVVRSADVFVDYICYIVAKNSNATTDELMEKLKDKDFHLETIPKYRGHLVFLRGRRGMFMRSVMDFLIGKRGVSFTDFDDQEYTKLKASFVIGNIASLGVALKYFGVFPKNRTGFSLSGIKVLNDYKNEINETRVTIPRDLWPIMRRDLLIFLNHYRPSIKSIMDLQYVVFVMFLHESKWFISSVLQNRKNPTIDPTPGIRLKDIKFSKTTEKCVTICSSIYEKQKTKEIKCICNEKKWCFVCLLIELLGHRYAFERPPLDAIEENSFTICSSRAEEFLFAQPDYHGRLQVNQCLTIGTATSFLDTIAATLRIPRSYIAFKSFRKAGLIQDAMEAVRKNNNITNIYQIVKKIRPNYRFPESLLQQLSYGNNNLSSALLTYNNSRQNDANIDFESCLRFISDISINTGFFTIGNELVEEIFKAFCPLWSSSDKQLSESVALCRKNMICNELNQFITYFRTVHNNHVPEEELNVEDKIEFETLFSFYTYSFTTEKDGIDSLKCFNCDFKASNSEKLKSHILGHQLPVIYSCTPCSKTFDITSDDSYSRWERHLRECHKFIYICRYCNLFITKNRKESCLNNSHNVIEAQQLHVRWENEKTTIPKPEETVENISLDQKEVKLVIKNEPISQEIKDE